jgi:DNA-binding GntR family transcriptional regulator
LSGKVCRAQEKAVRPAAVEPSAAKVKRNVSDDLRIRIERCELMPGERLKFKDLADRYDVSIGALCEELAILEPEGVVLGERNKGHKVPSGSMRLLNLTDLRILLERRALAQSIDAGDDAWEVRVISPPRLHPGLKRHVSP